MSLIAALTPWLAAAFAVLISVRSFTEIRTAVMWAGYTSTHLVRSGPTCAGT